MRQLVRDHARWVWGTFLGLSAICTVLVIFVPQLPRALASNWFIAWIFIPLAAGLLIRLIQINDRQHVLLHEKLAEIKSLKASLETPEPTARDRKLFERLIEEWPWNEGTLWWLENAFNAKQWSSNTASQVVAFADIERETFFDNPDVDASFQNFKKACDALSRWLTFESFPHPSNWDIQQVPDGSERAGGWPEFDALRGKGKDLSGLVIESRRDLERVGRTHGL